MTGLFVILFIFVGLALGGILLRIEKIDEKLRRANL